MVSECRYLSTDPTPGGKATVCVVVLAMTGFVSWNGYSPALALEDRMMGFNLMLLADAPLTEIANHTAIPA
jgi:hypothetical protein